jgi:hypothetical protein
MEYVGFSVIECSQPKGIKLKIGGCKLRSGGYWQRALKQEGVKQARHKMRAMCLLNLICSGIYYLI